MAVGGARASATGRLSDVALRSLLESPQATRPSRRSPPRVARRRRPGEGPRSPVSAGLRPLLLAALLEDERGLAGRPALVVAADDRSARDLAADLRAYLAPRRVRYYPSRGTGYASHVTPPPHLVGLRIDALDALAGRRARSAVVVASAMALAEAVPDASLRPAGFALTRGEEIDLGDVAETSSPAGYERVEQVEERGQFAVRGGILDVFAPTEERAARIELFGDEIESMRWFSTFTQRSLGEAERVELAPAAELDAEHRELAELAALTPPRRGRSAPASPSSCRSSTSARRSTWSPIGPRSSSPPPRRSSRPCATTGRTDDGDARRRRPPPLRRRRRAARGRARPARLTGAGDDDEEAPFRGSRAESPPRAASRRPRPSWRSWSAPATARSSPSSASGEAERARYGLDRLDAAILDGGRLSPDPGARLRRGAPARGLRQPRAAARRLSLPPPRPPPPRRGARRRPRPARLSATCGSATTSSTRTTASPASPASRPARSAASPATTSTSNTRARTGSTSPPTSSRS